MTEGALREGTFDCCRLVGFFLADFFPAVLALEDLAFLRAGGISGNAIESPSEGKKIDITEW